MPSSVLPDVLLATPPLLFGLVITWRLIWPWWKLPGKIVFYVAAVAALSLWLGHWSVVIGWLHQGLGLVFHIRFCATHGFTWYRVEDPARYRALSMASVGVGPTPEE